MKHRIAAGGIVIENNHVLLVRYPEGYLVAPGGGVEAGESLSQTVIRECREETGITVTPRHPVVLELIAADRYLMQKTWFLCDYVAGEPVLGDAARAEKIIEIAWYDQASLAAETVYPAHLKSMAFDELLFFNEPAIVAPFRQDNT